MTETKAWPHGAQEYNGNGNHEWEPVTQDETTERLRVPGGWLYSVAYDDVTNTVFVPTPSVVGYPI